MCTVWIVRLVYPFSRMGGSGQVMAYLILCAKGISFWNPHKFLIRCAKIVKNNLIPNFTKYKNAANFHLTR